MFRHVVYSVFAIGDVHHARLLGRDQAEPESGQFRRVRSVGQTMCPWMRVVYFAALQQIIFNADRAVLERVIRDQGRTSKSRFPSRFDSHP